MDDKKIHEKCYRYYYDEKYENDTGPIIEFF